MSFSNKKRKLPILLMGVLFCSSSVFALPEPLENPIPPPLSKGKIANVETIVSDLTAPGWGEAPPGHPNILTVADQNGKVWSINLITLAKSLFLDVATNPSVDFVTLNPDYDERGLLGFAFDPNFQSNGLFYTHTSENNNAVRAPDFSTVDVPGDGNHQSLVRKWKLADSSDLSSGITMIDEVLRIDQPQNNHNAGGLAFGPDGMLYMVLADGGGAADYSPGHSPQGNAQDTSNVFGSIMRIDVHGTSAPNGRYSVPGDNPFGSTGGQLGCDDGFCDEIYAYGFRNPYRISFDDLSGDLFLGDVGQGNIEEVDILEKSGGNYGWRVKEGSFCHYFNDINNDGVLSFSEPDWVSDPSNCDLGNWLIDPVAEYDHDEGISVIAGFVYRGNNPDMRYLNGRFIFGDYKKPTFFTITDGRLFYLAKRNMTADKKSIVKELMILDDIPLPDPSSKMLIYGFGKDASGEIYILGKFTFPEEGVFGPSGTHGFVKKIKGIH